MLIEVVRTSLLLINNRSDPFSESFSFFPAFKIASVFVKPPIEKKFTVRTFMNLMCYIRIKDYLGIGHLDKMSREYLCSN